MLFTGDKNRNREYWWSLSLDLRADHMILSFRTNQGVTAACVSIYMDVPSKKGFLNDSHMCTLTQDTHPSIHTTKSKINLYIKMTGIIPS